MRKFSILILTLIIASGLQAQFSKGLRMFAGSGYLSQNKRTITFTGSNPEQYSRNFNAELYLGLSVFDTERSFHTYSLVYQREHNEGNFFSNQATVTNQAAGLGYTHTRLYPAFKKLYVSLSTGGNVRVNFNQFIDTTGTFKANGFQISAGLTPGIVYQLKPRLLLQAQFNNLLALYYGYLNTPKVAGVAKNFEQGFRLSAGTNLGTLSGFGMGFYWVLKRG